jgi:hypothetical protein
MDIVYKSRSANSKIRKFFFKLIFGVAALFLRKILRLLIQIGCSCDQVSIRPGASVKTKHTLNEMV